MNDKVLKENNIETADIAQEEHMQLAEEKLQYLESGLNMEAIKFQ